MLYNELSQITPLPLAWDRTSLSQPAPTTDNGHLPDTTKAGAAAVYKFLDAQSKKLGSWATSPLWSVVDGPMKLHELQHRRARCARAEPGLVGNAEGRRSPSSSSSRSRARPRSTTGCGRAARARSRSRTSRRSTRRRSRRWPREGYDVNKAASYSFNYFPLNLNSNATTSPGGEPIRYIFRQTYFRDAFQHLIDQQGWINAFLYNTADPTCGPIPLVAAEPAGQHVGDLDRSVLVLAVDGAGSCSRATAGRSWPSGTTTCTKPGRPRECGAGIRPGEGISFNIDYESGVVSVQDEMNDLASQAKKLGINHHPHDAPVQHRGRHARRARRAQRRASGPPRTGAPAGSTGRRTCRPASRCTTRARPRTPAATPTRR